MSGSTLFDHDHYYYYHRHNNHTELSLSAFSEETHYFVLSALFFTIFMLITTFFMVACIKIIRSDDRGTTDVPPPQKRSFNPRIDTMHDYFAPAPPQQARVVPAPAQWIKGTEDHVARPVKGHAEDSIVVSAVPYYHNF